MRMRDKQKSKKEESGVTTIVIVGAAFVFAMGTIFYVRRYGLPNVFKVAGKIFRNFNSTMDSLFWRNSTKLVKESAVSLESRNPFLNYINPYEIPGADTVTSTNSNLGSTLDVDTVLSSKQLVASTVEILDSKPPFVGINTERPFNDTVALAQKFGFLSVNPESLKPKLWPDMSVANHDLGESWSSLAFAAAGGMAVVGIAGAGKIRNQYLYNNEIKISESTGNTSIPVSEKNKKSDKIKNKKDQNNTKKLSSKSSNKKKLKDKAKQAVKTVSNAAGVTLGTAAVGYGASSIFAYRRDQLVKGELDYVILRDKLQKLEKLSKERILTKEEDDEYAILLNTLQQLNPNLPSKTMSV